MLKLKLREESLSKKEESIPVNNPWRVSDHFRINEPR